MARLPALLCPFEHVDPGEQLSGSTGRSRRAATPCLVGGVAIRGAMRYQARPLVAVGQGPASHPNRQLHTDYTPGSPKVEEGQELDVTDEVSRPL